MPLKMTEREAEEFFGRLGRPLPRAATEVHRIATKAIEEALKGDIHESRNKRPARQRNRS